jgi:hypothetical protein
MAKIENHKLMTALDYRDSDFALNLQFKLSERQKQRLKPIAEINVALSFFLTTVCFILAVSGLYIGFGGLNIFLATLFGVAGFGLSFFWAFKSVQWEKRIKKYQGVKITEGTTDFQQSHFGIALEGSREPLLPVYTMTIGKTKFYITKKTYDVIPSGKIRVYYFQTLVKHILSVETIE